MRPGLAATICLGFLVMVGGARAELVLVLHSSSSRGFIQVDTAGLADLRIIPEPISQLDWVRDSWSIQGACPQDCLDLRQNGANPYCSSTASRCWPGFESPDRSRLTLRMLAPPKLQLKIKSSGCLARTAQLSIGFSCSDSILVKQLELSGKSQLELSLDLESRGLSGKLIHLRLEGHFGSIELDPPVYPYDPQLDLNADGTIDWSYQGQLTQPVDLRLNISKSGQIPISMEMKSLGKIKIQVLKISPNSQQLAEQQSQSFTAELKTQEWPKQPQRMQSQEAGQMRDQHQEAELKPNLSLEIAQIPESIESAIPELNIPELAQLDLQESQPDLQIRESQQELSSLEQASMINQLLESQLDNQSMDQLMMDSQESQQESQQEQVSQQELSQELLPPEPESITNQPMESQPDDRSMDQPMIGPVLSIEAQLASDPAPDLESEQECDEHAEERSDGTQRCKPKKAKGKGFHQGEGKGPKCENIKQHSRPKAEDLIFLTPVAFGAVLGLGKKLFGS